MANRSPRSTEIRIGGSRRAIPWLPALLALSVGANLWFLLRWAPEQPAVVQAPGDSTPADSTPAPAPVPTGAVAEPAEPTLTPPAEAVPGVATSADGTRYVKVTIDGPVAGAFVDKLGSPEGDRVALTASRLLSWNLKPSADARKGDTAEVLYRLDSTDAKEGADAPGVTILALRYDSAKFQKVFAGYRYQPAGWAFPSWFDEEGREVAERLVSGPIDDYEQITSLIGDGRGHAGMDFKAPVDTDVKSPFDGTVERTNWNWKNNGNCVELQTKHGKVRFLHLNELAEGVRPGTRVTAGKVLARSGNTGRSFAPHLHYEIVDGSGRVLDPLKVHGTTQRSLEGTERATFDIERDRWIDRMATMAATSQPPVVPAEPTSTP